MKDKDEFLKQMETLQLPDIDPSLHQQKVKMTIMNAERSAVLGVWLLIVPVYVLFCLLMSAYFHNKTFDNWAFGWALKAMFSKWWDPGNIILIAGPFASIIVNTLALINVQYHKLKPLQGKANELVISIKLKPLNIILLLVSIALACLFTLS